MGYLCAHCDIRFESSDEKPRCPKCLRLSGVAPEKESAEQSTPRPRSPMWLIVGLLSALVQLGAFLNGYLEAPGGAAGIAAMAGWLAWAAASAALIIVGLRGVLSRMH